MVNRRGMMVLLFFWIASPAMANQFLNFLQVSPFTDGEYWFLTTPLQYELLNSGKIVEVDAGFVTDFASIPRPFWVILPKWGKYGAPAVVHDFLYWDRRCSRTQADAVLLIAMEENKVNPVHRFLIHRAVRWGGFFAWRNNGRARKRGEERVIPEGYRPDQLNEEGISNLNVKWSELRERMAQGGVRPDERPSPEPAPEYCAEAETIWRQIKARRRG